MARKAGDAGVSPTEPPEGGAAAPGDATPRMTTEQYQEALYLRLMDTHRTIDAKLAEVDSGRKAIAKQRTAVRNQLKQAGYFLENVDNVLDASGKLRGSNEEAKVDQLHWMRERAGLPNAKSGEQLDLLNRLPETEKDAIMWEEDAYHQGLIGQPCELPAGCPPVFHQRWAAKWHEGKDRRDWARATQENPERDPVKAQTIGTHPVDLAPEPDDEEDDDAAVETEAEEPDADAAFDEQPAEAPAAAEPAMH